MKRLHLANSDAQIYAQQIISNVKYAIAKSAVICTKAVDGAAVMYRLVGFNLPATWCVPNAFGCRLHDTNDADS